MFVIGGLASKYLCSLIMGHILLESLTQKGQEQPGFNMHNSEVQFLSAILGFKVQHQDAMQNQNMLHQNATLR